ncbi:hypothetical protein ACI6QG_12120 [Roseococcus sp. DSY-14]|uniref:hypothetical protein n=1 Tax=Roseococcus sp. DSY-14 TaxID=3369650 RepID=UPI00387AFB7D
MPHTPPARPADGRAVPYDPMVALPEGEPALRSRASWGAILAGAVVAVTLGIMLNTLGVAVGAGTVDAVARDTPDAGAFTLGAAAWFAVSNIVALFIGGMVAAWLSGTSDRKDSAFLGLGAWAVSFLFAAVVMGQVAGNVAGRAADAAGAAVRGVASAAAGATGAAAEAAQGVDPRAAAERLRATLTAPADVGRMTAEQRAAEIAAISADGLRQGAQLQEGQRARLAQLIGAEAGISEAEARQRIQAAETQVRQTAEQAAQRAREAADAAATGAARSALWFFATMLLSAIAAVLGARAGTRGLVLAHQR